MSSISPQLLAHAFVDVADTLVDDFDLIEFLQRVAGHASELVGAAAVGLLLADRHGRLQLLAATDERAQMVELFQVQALEGPCQDCFRTVDPVSHPDLSQAAGSWPHFAPMAAAAGYRSVHAFPMRLRQEAIGALNLFSGEPGRLGAETINVIQALADVATIGVLQERAVREAEVLSQQLQAALDSRIVIEQAKGVLAQRHDETPDQAFLRLRSHARSHHLRLGELARSVVDGTETLGGPGSG